MLEPNFNEQQLKMLNTALRPDEIEHKQGMSYLKGQLAVVKANQIFGVGNWAYKQLGPIELTDTGVKNSKGNTISLVSATVELTVRGCETFVEQGDCEAQGMGAPAISMARKGAVTDGLKRCLKNFGPAFGLDLYFDTPPANSFNQPAQAQPRQITPQPQQQQQQAARPVTQPKPIPAQPAPAKPNPAPMANGEKATETQTNAILRMSGKQGWEEIELNNRLKELYGYGLSQLTKNDAGHFIQVLQSK